MSFLNSPRGFLGTDTGGKVATLEAMTSGPGVRLDPDLGYWAEEWDPDGSLYPLYYTAHYGDRWVNATTFPMLLAALPLYDVGGYRLALLLPMLGSVAAAGAAAALARRLGGPGRLAFWVVGLASPITIYALDFWEHAVGVACMAWAVVLLWDLVDGGARSWPRALAAGALFGVAATMRTESLVYVAAAGLVVAAVLVFGRARARMRELARPILVSGAAALVGLAVPVMANEALERALLDQGLRSGRAAATASIAGDAPAHRVTEAAYTLVGAEGSTRGVVLGAGFVALVAWAAARSRTDQRFAAVVLAAAAALLAVRFALGLGFVPGLFVAWPFAAAALAVGSRRWPVALALVALPVVVGTQFRGGAAPQWAGRYVLASGLLLTIAGITVTAGVARRAVVALAAAVTAFGLVWMSVRTHDVDRAITAIGRRPEPVIVSAVAHLAREGGATHGERRWLTAPFREQWQEAADVVEQAGEREFLLVALADVGPAPTFEGWSAGRPERLELFDGVDLRVVRWTKTDSR